MSEPTSRRDFLAVAAAAVATAGCGAADPTSVNSDPGGDPMNFPGSTRSPSNPSGTDTTLCSGSTAGLIVGPAAQDLALNQVLPVPGAPGNVSPFYVCRDSTGIVGLYNKCTHLGCTPVYFPDLAIWRCPCHGSSFGVTGNLLGGAATTSMARYATCKGSDGLIRIDLSKKLP